MSGKANTKKKTDTRDCEMPLHTGGVITTVSTLCGVFAEIRGFHVGGSEARARTQLLQLPYVLSMYVACGAETVTIVIGYDTPYRYFRYDGAAVQRVGSYSNTINSVELTPGKEWPFG